MVNYLALLTNIISFFINARYFSRIFLPLLFYNEARRRIIFDWRLLKNMFLINDYLIFKLTSKSCISLHWCFHEFRVAGSIFKNSLIEALLTTATNIRIRIIWLFYKICFMIFYYGRIYPNFWLAVGELLYYDKPLLFLYLIP